MNVPIITKIGDYSKIKAKAVYIYHHLNSKPQVFDVCIQGNDEINGAFYNKNLAVEYAEFLKQKAENEQTPPKQN